MVEVIGICAKDLSYRQDLDPASLLLLGWAKVLTQVYLSIHVLGGTSFITSI